jgi:hypothetical protein
MRPPSAKAKAAVRAMLSHIDSDPIQIDPHTGAVSAYVFGRCQYAVLLQLQALLEPLGLTRFSTDYWGA